jgi:hypothetical protein
MPRLQAIRHGSTVRSNKVGSFAALNCGGRLLAGHRRHLMKLRRRYVGKSVGSEADYHRLEPSKEAIT